MGIQILEELAPYAAGQLGDGPHNFVGSRVLQSDAPAGAFVIPTADNECNLPSAATAADLAKGGILTLLVDRNPKANGLEYAAGERGLYVTSGYIVGLTETAVNDHDPVFVRVRVSGGDPAEQIGALRPDVNEDGEDTAVLTVVTTDDDAVLRLEDGDTDLSFVSGNSQTAADKATAWAAAIDAIDGYTATADNAEITVVKEGSFDFGSRSPASVFTLAHNPECVRLPGAYFVHDAAAGLALVKLPG